jgi:hypothetical protein
VFYRCAKLTRRWGIIQTEDIANQLECVAKMWEARGAGPPPLPYPGDRSSTSRPDDQSMVRIVPAPSGCDAQCNSEFDTQTLVVSSQFSVPEQNIELQAVVQPMLTLQDGAVTLSNVLYE